MPTLSLLCPRMAINRVNGHLKRTAVEPMTATLDGQPAGIVSIPETDVHEPHPWNPLVWLVDPCVGTGDGFTVSLPEEPCGWDFRLGKIVAKSIVAPVTYDPQDLLPGEKRSQDVMTGSVTFPDCPIDEVLLATCYAQVITAEGEIS